MNSLELIKNRVEASIAVKQQLLNNENLLKQIAEVSNIITQSLKKGGKLLLCGNGGSAADAQHIAAEFTGRFYKEREPLFAEALHVNSSYMTAVSNDYGFHLAYQRLVKAKGKKGDVLIGISTSGNSANVVNAVEKGNEIGMITIALAGISGGKLSGLAHHNLLVPSDDTPRIQEAHILIGHLICEIVENNFSE